MKIVKKIGILIIIVMVGWYSLNKYMTSGVEEDFFTDIYLYLWNGNLNIAFFLVFLIGFQELCVIDSYQLVNNGFDKKMIVRLGYLKYYFHQFKTIVVKSIGYYLLIHVVFLFSELMIYGYQEVSELDKFKYQLFNENPLSNLIIYILLSAIGVAIFNCLIFSFSTLIKNKYVFRFLPLIFLFASILLSALISPLIQGVLGYDELVKTIALSLMIISILEPGMVFMRYGYLSFSLAVIWYLMITGLVILVTKKMRQRYDE